MSDMNDNAVRRLDFMLLLVLREGVRRRKLSDVAGHLGVTQTAISHAVARLRDLFDDELFIRRPHGVEPTARAVQLAALAEQMLETAGTMLADPTPFDPATAQRTLRIAALDYEVTILSELICTMQQLAPAVPLRFIGLSQNAAIEALDRNAVDLWIGFERALPPSMQSVRLFEEDYTVIARRDHPRIRPGNAICLDAFCAEGHVVAAPGGQAGGIVDEALAETGRSRTVQVLTPGFMPAVELVARSNLIATIPSRLAHAQTGPFGLMTLKPPVTPRPFSVAATWHKRAGGDPLIEWAVAMLVGAFS